MTHTAISLFKKTKTVYHVQATLCAMNTLQWLLKAETKFASLTFIMILIMDVLFGAYNYRVGEIWLSFHLTLSHLCKLMTLSTYSVPVWYILNSHSCLILITKKLK